MRAQLIKTVHCRANWNIFLASKWWKLLLTIGFLLTNAEWRLNYFTVKDCTNKISSPLCTYRHQLSFLPSPRLWSQANPLVPIDVGLFPSCLKLVIAFVMTFWCPIADLVNIQRETTYGSTDRKALKCEIAVATAQRKIVEKRLQMLAFYSTTTIKRSVFQKVPR